MYYTEDEMVVWAKHADRPEQRKVACDVITLYAKIERLRDLRRSECTEFASIAGVDDSRDTRIVLHDARVKMETLCNAAAAVVEVFWNSPLNMGEGRLYEEMGNLRRVAGIKSPPADEAIITPEGE